MQNHSKHIVRLARQEALSSFSALVGEMLLDTNTQVVSVLRGAPAADQKALQATRYWFNDNERVFRRLMLEKFTVLLERAIDTMHTDLRAGLHDMRADNLSLVDDDVMTRQVELDRLVTRLHDVDEMSLGRINLIIATLHGVSKVRERENPYRPYLAARALYESVRETAADPAIEKILFEYMSTAMANRLPGYYAAILAHFEARGLDARLLAQPSDMTRAQRERMNAGYDTGAGSQRQGLQELVWQVLDERPASGPAGASPDDRLAPAASAPAAQLAAAVGAAAAQSPQRFWLTTQFKRLQQERGGAETSDALSPLALSEQIGEKAEPLDRMTIDLTGLVFDYILHDELMLPEMRLVIGRLHVPFMRAAVFDPDLLQTSDHPARSLLDRLGTLAAAMQLDTGPMQALGTDAARLVNQVRDTFDTDIRVFSEAERALDDVVAALQQQASPLYAQLRDAIATGETHSGQLATAQARLAVVLAPLALDPRLASFIDGVWIEVMLRQGGGVVQAGLLPELIWSAQEKATPADRSVLMRALPDLVRRIREGIALLGLPAAASQAALDQLVAVHMDVLGQRIAPGGKSMSLDWLHVHFGQLGEASAQASAPQPMSASALATLLASHGLRASVQPEPPWRDALPVDDKWLASARPGAGFKTEIDGSLVLLRLETISVDGSVFIFSAPAPTLPQIYRKNALLAAMHAGSLRPIEYAPLFERAVGSAMTALAAPPAGV